MTARLRRVLAGLATAAMTATAPAIVMPAGAAREAQPSGRAQPYTTWGDYGGGATGKLVWTFPHHPASRRVRP